MICNQRYHSLSFQAIVSGFRDHMQYDRERERRSRSGNFTAVDEKASFGRWKLSLLEEGLPTSRGLLRPANPEIASWRMCLFTS